MAQTETATRTDLIESRIDREAAGAIALTNLGARFGSMLEIMEFAKMMATAGPAIRPVFRNNPGACLRVAIQANHFGFEPFSFASKCYFVNDELSYEAQLIHAIILARAGFVKRPTLSYSGSGEGRKCKVILHLPEPDGDKDYESPALKDIKVKSPLWTSDPDQQLAYYSIRAAARRHIPDVILGMYDPEELAASQARDVNPRPPTVSDKLKSGPALEVVYTSGKTAEPAKPTKAADEPQEAQDIVAAGSATEAGEATSAQPQPADGALEAQTVEDGSEELDHDIPDLFERAAIAELRTALAKADSVPKLAVVEDEFSGTMNMASEVGKERMRALILARGAELGGGDAAGV